MATDHADASWAALRVLAGGGSAADGAIAAALALGVVSPAASGIGGGGFALVYSAKERRVRAIDFRERAPATLALDVVTARARAGPKADPQARGVSIGVPGEPAGLDWLSRHYGKLPLSAAAAPAVQLADGGYYASRHLAHTTAAYERDVARDPITAALFLPGGKPIGAGARMQSRALAATLRRFGSEGRRALYEGPIAARTVASARALGSTMTLADLARYEVRERAPLTRSFGERTVFTMPAPSAGGLMLLEALSLYGADGSSELATHGHGSSASLHLMAEAMRGAVADRARVAGDPDLEPSVDASYAALLEPAQIAARRKRIRLDATRPTVEFKTRESGTSHLVVADAEGNVVSLTTTINGAFGAFVTVPETGVVLNNELDDFSGPDDGRAFAIVAASAPNRPRPDARPVSSMTPTIVLERGLPILALGGSGGTRIATGVTQAAVCRLVFALDPMRCVSSPRIHVGASGAVLVDPDVPADVRSGLAARGEKVEDETFLGAAVQMVAWERDEKGKKLRAASDPRKGGFAVAQ